ncbi:unnamed protein product [Calicophoron daubneyi]|uniref:SAC3/GANP/THP3 conserved domain-containing protein n=1 Tax=Calicophoron daubneyi TaxID=300641 RepID=A0AAV2T4I9_CALDB
MFGTTNSGESKNLFTDIPTASTHGLFPQNPGTSGTLFSSTKPQVLFGAPSVTSSESKGDQKTSKQENLFSSSYGGSLSHGLFNPVASKRDSQEANVSEPTPHLGLFTKLKSHQVTPTPQLTVEREDDEERRPSYWPAVRLSRLPAGLNQKPFLKHQFERFGPITRIICQPSLDSAFIAFETVTAAQRAKRYGHDAVLPTEEGLPSTVLLSLAQCRSRTSSSASRSSGPPISPVRTHPLFRKKTPSGKCTTSKRQSVSPAKESPPPVSSSEVLFSSDEEDQASKQCHITSQQKLFTASANPHETVKPSLAGTTVEQRISILEAQYKAERERIFIKPQTVVSSHTDLSGFEDQSSVELPAILGTCMDMCPELERYLRDFHQRVSIFECLPSTINAGSSGWLMDHTRAVKDYQRSSADQPVPLPCELRPTAVLHRTMRYLLASVADRPELDTTRSLWKSWYEFMWTRTRAIRKDVVQQRLCSPEIVGVMERIARFHIFCAARLVDQPIDSFDPRINSENLTQCLQTLKEMYNDLIDDSSPNRPCCPCEPEFRGYMLLMKLNDQGALNSVQKLPERLLRSGEVRFAVSVHEAVTTNNYIRFFRLVRQTTCLNACLMHRYFVQVRSQALLRLAYSFTGHPKREVQYPIRTLVRQLGFENEQEAKDFCEAWGLTVIDDYLIFEKQTPPQAPELPWRERRAVHLIEDKRSGITLSTLFSNGPVSPADALPSPVHSSFDTDGKFLGSLDQISNDTNVRGQEFRGELPKLTSESDHTPPALQSPCSFASKPTELEELVNNNILMLWFVGDWISENIDCKPVVKQTMAEECIAIELTNRLIDEFVHSQLIELSYRVLNQKLALEEASVEVRDDIFDHVIKEELQDTATELLAATQISDDLLLNELLPDLIQSVARSCLLTAKADWFHHELLLRRCVTRLHQWIEGRKREKTERAQLRAMPACPASHVTSLDLFADGASRILQSLRQSKLTVGVPTADGQTHATTCVDSFQEFLKRPRFSSWSQQVDHKLTWAPLRPHSRSMPSIGFYRTNSIKHYKCLKVLSKWVRKKLRLFNLVTLTEWPDETVLDSLYGLVCIGEPDRRFQQSINSAKPILILKPQLNLDLQDDPGQEVGNSSLASLLATTHSFCFPYTENGKFVPTLCWSAVLQAGIDWMDSVVSEEINSTQPVLSTHFPHRQHPVAGLVDVVWHFIDANFLRPLAMLARDWYARGLVDPSLKSLSAAYNSTLDRMYDLIPDQRTIADLKAYLNLPSDALESLNQLFHRNSSVPAVWSDLTYQWSLLADQVQLGAKARHWTNSTIARSEQAFLHAACLIPSDRSPFVISPLVPWLDLCLAIVNDRLEQCMQFLSRSSFDHSNSIENILGSLCTINENSVLDELTAHFLKFDEPKLTYCEAVCQCLEITRRYRIVSALDATAQSDSSDQLCPKPSLKRKIDMLFDRMQDVEKSMHEVIDESLSGSQLSSAFHSTCLSKSPDLHPP